MGVVTVLSLAVSFYRAYNMPNKDQSVQSHLPSTKKSLVDKDINEVTIGKKKSTQTGN